MLADEYDDESGSVGDTGGSEAHVGQAVPGAVAGDGGKSEHEEGGAEESDSSNVDEPGSNWGCSIYPLQRSAV